jgi:hypothetical protein
MNGMNNEKDGLEGKKKLAKKRSSLAFSTIFVFFDSFVPYNKNDLHKKQLEKNVV